MFLVVLAVMTLGLTILWFPVVRSDAAGLMYSLLFSVGIAVLATGLALGTVMAITRKRLRIAAFLQMVHAAQAKGTRFLSPRVLAVALVTVLTSFVVSLVSPSLGSPILSEVGYYFVLMISGLVLAAYCKAQPHVPILTATLSLLFLIGVSVAMFLTNSEAQFRFGPEIVLFAFRRHLGLIITLPADVAVAFLAYWVAYWLSAPAATELKTTAGP
jgi:uncharacterized membrane protein YiaA